MAVQIYPAPAPIRTHAVKTADETRAGAVAVDTELRIPIAAGKSYLLEGFIACAGGATLGTVTSAVVTAGMWNFSKASGKTTNFGTVQEFYSRTDYEPYNTPVSACFTATGDGFVQFNWGGGTVKQGTWLSVVEV